MSERKQNKMYPIRRYTDVKTFQYVGYELSKNEIYLFFFVIGRHGYDARR